MQREKETLEMVIIETNLLYVFYSYKKSYHNIKIRYAFLNSRWKAILFCKFCTEPICMETWRTSENFNFFDLARYLSLTITLVK